MQVAIDFVIDHKTQQLAKQGGLGDIVVNQLGTFIVSQKENTRGFILKCLYPVISE